MATIDFSDWLSVKLDEQEMKPADLARKAELDKSVVTRILNRERNPEPKTLTAIARALRLPPEQVFRAAGLLPPTSNTDSLTEEGIHILNQLEGEYKDEALRQLRLRLQVQEERGKSNVGKRKARPSES